MKKETKEKTPTYKVGDVVKFTTGSTWNRYDLLGDVVSVTPSGKTVTVQGRGLATRSVFKTSKRGGLPPHATQQERDRYDWVRNIRSLKYVSLLGFGHRESLGELRIEARFPEAKTEVTVENINKVIAELETTKKLLENEP